MSDHTIADWDERDLEDLDYQPAPRDHTAQFTRWMLARLCGDELQRYTSQGPGECEECERHRFARFTYGTFALCFDCLTRRLHVNAKLEQRDYHDLTKPLTAQEALALARTLHQADAA